jgi:hypothetical protein
LDRVAMEMWMWINFAIPWRSESLDDITKLFRRLFRESMAPKVSAEAIVHEIAVSCEGWYIHGEKLGWKRLNPCYWWIIVGRTCCDEEWHYFANEVGIGLWNHLMSEVTFLGIAPRDLTDLRWTVVLIYETMKWRDYDE